MDGCVTRSVALRYFPSVRRVPGSVVSECDAMFDHERAGSPIYDDLAFGTCVPFVPDLVADATFARSLACNSSRRVM